MARTDAFSVFDAILANHQSGDPWTHARDEIPQYAPDYGLLEKLLTIPVAAGKKSATGVLANGVDSWIANEFRRARFSPDEIWPRATIPRVMPRDIAVLLDKLPSKLSEQVREKVDGLRAVGPSDAKFLGRAYEKQVDVALARWDRGPEMLLSTKTQASSFGKNLSNRFEEAYGDAGNLRSRYPLAAVGFLFVQRATILTSERDAFERTLDMMRKLRDPHGLNGYTATGLILVDWEGETGDEDGVQVRLDDVPEDIRPEQFMQVMISHILSATPVSAHVHVRSLMERREIPVTEDDEMAENE
ncbi:MAG: hypothetical protein K0R01_7 [Mycobacterium sp.]|nr:hypothetical protein [Mycobacterium sp.]